MMLPDELVWIMDKLGFEWPDLDEDEMRRGATLLQQFGTDLGATIEALDRRLNIDIVDASSSKTVLAIADAWTQNRSQNLQQLVDAIGPAATGVDVFADAVLALKIKVIADITITAAQVAAALASSLVTFGAGAAAAVGLIIARKAALDFVMNVAVEEVMGQVLPLVIEPLTEHVPAVVNAILDAPLVTGAVAEIGEFTADLGALRQSADALDLAAADQATLTEQFLNDLANLNITGA